MKPIFFQKLAGVFIANREMGVLTILGIVLFGMIGFTLMPKQYNPEIVAPAFRIDTQYQGASAQEVYEVITRPMEDKVREIPLVDDIFAQSRAGYSSVTVTFKIGADKEAAKINLVQRLRSNMDDKPSGAVDPLITEIDTDDVPIVTFALTSPQLSETSLRAFAFDVADTFKLVDGTAKVTVYGGQTQELRVTLDPERAASYGVDASMVAGALSANNVHVTDGVWEGDTQNIPARVYGNLTDTQSVGAITVAPGVRVDDVATVTLAAAKRDSYSTLATAENTQAAVYIGIAKHAGTNATVIAQNIADKARELSEGGMIPPYITMTTVRDDGAVAADEITGLTKNLITSIGIVTLVLLVFLSTRSALIVATAIPLSLLTVFGFGLLYDQTINRITLFALILSLGLLVDSATVVVENMVRHLKDKKDYEDDAEVITRSVGEVATGLIMSTVTTVLAFIPMAFVGGMMGPYMGPIPFFVPVALVASLVIALTVNPFLGYILLRGEKSTKASRSIIARVQRGAHRIVGRVQNTYAAFLARMFAHKKQRRTLVWTVVLLLLISIMLPAFGIVKFRMLPKADRDQFYIYLDMPAYTALAQTEATTRALEAVVLADEQVESVQGYVGMAPVIDFNGLFKGAEGRREAHNATLKVNLVSADDRSVKSQDIAARMRTAIIPVAQHAGAAVTIVEDPPGPPVLATFHVKVQGHAAADNEQLRAITQDVAQMVREIDEVKDVDTSAREYGVETTYRVNAEKATASGISTQQIATTLGAALHGADVGIYHDTLTNDTRYPEERHVMVRYPQEAYDAPADLARIQIATPAGSASLADLLTSEDAPREDIVTTDARKPTLYVSGEMGERSVVYASIDLLKKLHDYRLLSSQGELVGWNLYGMTYRDADGKTYDIKIGGEWELTLEVFTDMGIAFGVAILVIYFVLVAQFASMRIPLYILATIPLALIGVLPGFALLGATLGTYFTATAMIGVIALAGIVVNNAIIYLEYVFQLRAEDMALEDALIEAGKTRLLPIALTSLTTILGSLTIIADPVWEGLAWSIVLGLSLSAFLTLIMLPLIYRKFEQ